jgi:aspartyl-tRNA(Asn)/glutamyl-tRNA(Gln) amidotransferase subunit C
MAKTKTDINHLAKLANVPITKKELDEFSLQLPDILRYVDEIQRLEVKTNAQTAQVTHKHNELRADIISPGLTQEAALSQAKETHNGYFLVPAIFNEAK